MNAITLDIESLCASCESYESIHVDDIEDSFLEWPGPDPSKPYGYKKTIDYWKTRI